MGTRTEMLLIAPVTPIRAAPTAAHVFCGDTTLVRGGLEELHEAVEDECGGEHGGGLKDTFPERQLRELSEQ